MRFIYGLRHRGVIDLFDFFRDRFLFLHCIREFPDLPGLIAEVKVGDAQLVGVAVGPEIFERRLSVHDSPDIVIIALAIIGDLLDPLP